MSDSSSTSNKSIPGVVAGSGAEKPRANHQRTLQILRAMTPQQKLAQVFKLNERTLNLMRIGLRQRHPDLDEAAFEKLYLQMRMRCHNQRY
jgi:hypothetical protein